MIYFYALPVILFTTALTSAVWQQIFGGFTDLSRVSRHVAMIALAWALGGWLLEARAGETMASLYAKCESEIQMQLEELDELVFRLLGKI